jgi:virginiamycin B lyase
MPMSHGGPRRFDIDARGTLWIPAYSTNELVRYDSASHAFRRFELPVCDAVPYVVRIDHGNGAIWIGTGAADALLRFDSGTQSLYRLRPAEQRRARATPGRRSADAQRLVAYGASPGIRARVARLAPR